MLPLARASLSPGARDVTQNTGKRLGQTAGIYQSCRAGSDSRCVTDGLPELLGVFRTQAPGSNVAVEGGRAGSDSESWRQTGFATRQANFFVALGPGPVWRKALLLGQMDAEEQDEPIVPAIEHKVVESKHERDARHARAFERSLPPLRRYTRRSGFIVCAVYVVLGAWCLAFATQMTELVY